MKTYLRVWFSTAGEKSTEVNDRLMSMGFSPKKGTHDYVYDWGEEEVATDKALVIADRIHSTLGGCGVLFSLETVKE